MVHTGFVAKVQDKKRLANHRNPLEEFSICPVYTGMNLSNEDNLILDIHLPRIHGDEPLPAYTAVRPSGSAPYTRG